MKIEIFQNYIKEKNSKTEYDNVMSSRWKELVQEYRNSCTVPEHPKKCPDCSSKVSVYQMNFDDAIFMCSNEDVSIKVYMYTYLKSRVTEILISNQLLFIPLQIL